MSSYGNSPIRDNTTTALKKRFLLVKAILRAEPLLRPGTAPLDTLSLRQAWRVLCLCGQTAPLFLALAFLNFHWYHNRQTRFLEVCVTLDVSGTATDSQGQNTCSTSVTTNLTQNAIFATTHTKPMRFSGKTELCHSSPAALLIAPVRYTARCCCTYVLRLDLT